MHPTLAMSPWSTQGNRWAMHLTVEYTRGRKAVVIFRTASSRHAPVVEGRVLSRSLPSWKAFVAIWFISLQELAVFVIVHPHAFGAALLGLVLAGIIGDIDLRQSPPPPCVQAVILW